MCLIPSSCTKRHIYSINTMDELNWLLDSAVDSVYYKTCVTQLVHNNSDYVCMVADPTHIDIIKQVFIENATKDLLSFSRSEDVVSNGVKLATQGALSRGVNAVEIITSNRDLVPTINEIMVVDSKRFMLMHEAYSGAAIFSANSPILADQLAALFRTIHQRIYPSYVVS